MTVPPIRSGFALPRQPTTRFAPSLTGFLHLGHVANAVWTWGAAQASQGRVLLRMEDHDRGRWRSEFEPSILRDLEWLGLEPDEVSRRSLAERPSPFRQSDNDARYRAALTRLGTVAPIYHCICSRRTIAHCMGTTSNDRELRYSGTCREKGLAAGPGRAIRVVLPDREVEFSDLRLGAIRQRPAEQCGDLLLRDATGNWTYQFCVVVDDLEQDVDLVVRGEDILPSTGRQILLGEMLQWRRPSYLHHPLIHGDDGVKLSKRTGSAGIDQWRAEGMPAVQVLGMAAALTGLLGRPRPIAAGELGALFTGD